MAPDKDGTCLYCPNLPFCQEISWTYVILQQHQLNWCCGSLLPVKPWGLGDWWFGWNQQQCHALCVMNKYFSQCTLSTQPAMSVSTKQCKMLTRWDSLYFLWIEWIHKPIQIFHSENFINSSYKSMAWKDQVLHANFSSFLSEIQFNWAYEIGQPKTLLTKLLKRILDSW